MKEATEREINLKALNEQIMQAMDNLGSRNEKGKDVLKVIERSEAEIKNIKLQSHDKITLLEHEVFEIQ